MPTGDHYIKKQTMIPGSYSTNIYFRWIADQNVKGKVIKLLGYNPGYCYDFALSRI